MRVVAVGTLLVAVLAMGVASAGAVAPGSPTVLCKQSTFPGRSGATTPGTYSSRPRTCALEMYGYSRAESAGKLLKIHWKSWTGITAHGSALIPLVEENLESGNHRVGREKVFVSLRRPRRTCGGRLVFTRASVRWLYGDFDYPFRLHRVPVLGRGCPVASGSAATTHSEIQPPDAETGPATVSREHVVGLEAIIYPKGHYAWYWFQVGMTQRYGRITEPQVDEGQGAYGPETTTELFCHFRPETTYHYRLVVKNRAGKGYGQDRTFRTRGDYLSNFCF